MRSLLVIAITVVTVLFVAPAAHASKPTREVKPGSSWSKTTVTHLTHLKHGRVFVKFSNGSRYNMRPCRYEDGKRCFWNSSSRGNGIGTSFVRLKGHTFYWSVKDFRRQERARGFVRTHPVWGHKKCMINIGDTSYIRCYDGYRTSS